MIAYDVMPTRTTNQIRVHAALDDENKKELRHEKMLERAGMPIVRCPICYGRRKNHLLVRICEHCGAEVGEQHGT